MELTVDFLPALIKRVKPYEDMHEHLKTLLLAFVKKLKSKNYGPNICLKVIKSIQYYAQVCVDLSQTNILSRRNITIQNVTKNGMFERQ